MPRKSNRNRVLLLPARQLLLRVSQFFILTFLLVMLVAGRSGNVYVLSFKDKIGDLVAPSLDFVSAPFDVFHDISSSIKNWSTAYQQNQEFKNEISILLQWQAEAKKLTAENQKLRAMLNVVPPIKQRFVTANIVSDHGSAFSNSALIDAGRTNSIEIDQAAISELGLVGRVVAVGENSAQILLPTDVTSRIPVMNERTREKMILSGRGSNLPSLSYVPANSSTQIGDRIITSGDGGVFPKNIAVGIVKEIDKTAIEVDLFSDIADIEMVSIILP